MWHITLSLTHTNPVKHQIKIKEEWLSLKLCVRWMMHQNLLPDIIASRQTRDRIQITLASIPCTIYACLLLVPPIPIVQGNPHLSDFPKFSQSMRLNLSSPNEFWFSNTSVPILYFYFYIPNIFSFKLLSSFIHLNYVFRLFETHMHHIYK